jgi:cell division transport system ATP-binding protein
MEESFIEFKKVSRHYEKAIYALTDMSFIINRGEFVFIIGPSGSGKSTIIKLILKEIEPTSGEIYLAGKNICKLHRKKITILRRNIGCVFEDFKLLPKKTAYENIAFALEVLNKPRYEITTKVPQILKLVGLEDKTNNYPDQLSAGEQQRVSIARAFVNKPPLLLADEPTGNIDPEISLEIIKLLARINNMGTTVVMTSHDWSLVDKMRKRVIELDSGHIVRDQMRGIYGYEK